MRARARALLAGVLLTSGPMLGAVATAAPAASQPPSLAPDKPGKPDKPESAKPGKPGGDKPGKKKRKPDRTAPAVPSVGGTSSGPNGYVSVSVSAEAGSRVVVRAKGSGVVAVGYGTGGYSSVGWNTSTGNHVYTVRAVDGAGNASRSATFSAYADASPPALRGVIAEPGNEKDARTRVSFTTDAGSTYRIVSGGKLLRRGTTGTERVRERVDLGNGGHRVTVEVRDKVGNLRSAWDGVRVDVTSLRVRADVVSKATNGTQVITVKATPNARRAVLKLPGERTERVRMRYGSGDLKLKLEDGTYEGGTVRVRDSQGRIGRVKVPELVVDTTPPRLQVKSDPDAASEGTLGLQVTADEGDEVTWQLLDGNDVVDDGSYTSDGVERTLEEDVDAGEFRLAVSATDDFGRTTTDVTTTRIGTDPMPLGLITLVVLGLLALVGAVAAGARLLRRHPPAWGLRAKRRLAATTATVSARARAVAMIPQQRRAQELVEDEWYRRDEELTALLAAATGQAAPGGEIELPEVGPLPHEQVFYTAAARLFEAGASTSDSSVVTVEGELVVTSMRIAFVARGAQRDWWRPLVEELRHDGDDLTLVKRWHDDAWTGFEYDDPELTRMYLDLTVAEQHGTKDAFLERVQLLVDRHRAERPSVAPGPQVPAQA